MLVGVRLYLGLVLEDACCLITPELAERLACCVAYNPVARESAGPDIVAVELQGLVLYLREVKTYAVCEVGDMVVPVDAELPSGSLHLAHVLPHLSVPHRIAQYEEVVLLHKHVVRCLMEVVGCNLQAALQEGEVKTNVPVFHCLPLKVSVANA